MRMTAVLRRVAQWRPFTRMFVTLGVAAILAISLVYLAPASRGVGFAQGTTTILPTTILPTTSTTILPTTTTTTTTTLPPPPPVVLDHFMCYDVTEVDKPQGRRPEIKVEVTNQFGTAFFMVDKPRLLCLPSAKTELP